MKYSKTSHVRSYLLLQKCMNDYGKDDLLNILRLKLYISTTLVAILIYISVIVQTKNSYWNNPFLFYTIHFLFIGIFINYLVINIHRTPQLAYKCSILIFYLLLHILTYKSGGIKNPGNAYLLCLILYTYILTGKKTGQLLVVISICHFAYFYLVTEQTSWVDNSYVNNDESMINLDYLVTFLVSVFVIWRQSGFLEKSHKDIVASVIASSMQLSTKENEKMQLRQAATESELMALRAQMNPHFIFNCISSIQHYVFTNNLEQANNYLTGFAQLIRQTLDNSSQKTISIANEVSYLDTYLKLEQMRFSGKFTYRFIIDPGIRQDVVHIPNLLLQPFVENSIRHGIRYRKDNDGFISLHFSLTDEAIHFSLEDNGIGRREAALLKSAAHIEYQSKGMTLTRERVASINKSFAESIRSGIIDLVDEQGRATGTRVSIDFPLTLINKLS